MAKVRFEINAPGAKSVNLVGDFNGWDKTACKMRRSPKSKGVFLANVELPPGQYEYKYLVDGNWVCAEEGPRVPDPFGGENSVIVVE